MYYKASTTARDSFARGDEVLQLAIPLNQQSGRVGPGGGDTSSRRADASNELNRVVREGWSLVTASVVFVPTTETSRDKFWLSGQQVAISGEVVGYYVFTRDETKRTESVEPTMHRHVQERPVRRPKPTSEITPLAPPQ
jgi:hypothetical protein